MPIDSVVEAILSGVLAGLSKIWFLLPLIVLVPVLRSAWFKGVAGEFLVNISAGLLLDKSRFHLIKNTTLPTTDGTTQIDHIIVSEAGVFVVETKNMKGWIYGNGSQPQWTQKIFRQSYKFQNPLHQNYKHVKVLQELLGLQDHQVHSVVVFVGDATFKTSMPANVTKGGGYIRLIKSHTLKVLTGEKVKEVIQTIEASRLEPSRKTDREHIKHVNSLVADKNAHKAAEAASPPAAKEASDTSKCNDKAPQAPTRQEDQDKVICPKCRSEMIKRKFKKGEKKGIRFWGCSTFPTCRGIVEIDPLPARRKKREKKDANKLYMPQI